MEEKQALNAWIRREDVSAVDVERLFGRLMDGEISEVGKAALLVALAAKGETVDEIVGAARAMRSRVVAIPHSFDVLVDTCGTGGDGAGTFNISTAAAFVAAAAGVRIAKHGNRSVSSKSGSADVLEELGVELLSDPKTISRALSDLGIAFLFAPALHPAMKEVMPVRRELGVRTIFNLLGPLTNPAGATRQVVGVFAAQAVEPIARVLVELGTRHALVVHGDDGLDEITTTGPTLVAEVRGGAVEVRRIEPGDFGIRTIGPEELRGGEPHENAKSLRAVLDGSLSGPLLDITALNAGAAIYVAGEVASLQEGVGRAIDVLERGAAWTKLEELRDFR